MDLKLIKYSVIGLFCLSVLLSHSVPAKAETGCMTIKDSKTVFTDVMNGQVYNLEGICSDDLNETIITAFPSSPENEVATEKEESEDFLTTEYYVCVTQAYRYSGPGTNYSITGTLYRYNVVWVYTINNGWAKFKVNGVWNYIAANCITKA